MREPLTDDRFWDIVDNDASFRARFQSRVHPLVRQNGGVSFHNPQSMKVLLQQARRDYEALPKVGMSAWARKNRIVVLEAWLKQVRFIFSVAGDDSDAAAPIEF